jgi:DNA-binding NarL/FixJ family response regulator
VGSVNEKTEPIRVMLADDQELIRAGLRTLVESDPTLSLVGEASDGSEVVELAHRAHPDVILMDIRMPGVDGIEATRRISKDPVLADVRVLVLTTFGEDKYVFGALRAGASGFLLKDTRPAEVLAGIHTVAGGDGLLSPNVTRRLIAEFVAQPDVSDTPSGTLSELTEREREVLALIARGRSNDEIAVDLTISPLTAKTYVSRILTKTGARDRAQLVMLAYENGLVQPSG